MAMLTDGDPTTATKPCPFREVPMEVLLRIAFWLPTTDLCNMRRTCHSIERMLYRSFAHEYFRCKQFMLTPFSLQALIDISGSRLGRHLTRLQLGTDHFEDPLSVATIDGADLTYAYDCYATQCEMLLSGSHIDMLAEALQNLGHLEDVVIRCFNSDRRSRDGPGADWVSYGARQARREARNFFMAEPWHARPKPAFTMTSIIFNAVLTALSRTGTRPRGIEVLARQPSPMSAYLYDVAFAVSPAMRPSVSSVLEGLKKLHLYVGNAVDPFNRQGDTGKLPWFLHRTVNLEDLRINGGREKIQGLDRLLRWLATPASSSPSPSPPSSSTSQPRPGPWGPLPLSWPPAPALSQLTDLSLGYMAVESEVVIGMVQKLSPTIRRLDFVFLCVIEVADDAADEVPTGTVWKNILSVICDAPAPHLSHVGLKFLREFHGEPPKDPPDGVYRQGEDVVFKDGKTEMSYTGLDCRQVLLQTIGQVGGAAGDDDGGSDSFDSLDDDSGDSHEEDGSDGEEDEESGGQDDDASDA
ncbi:hypothetical protein GMORB2_6608 [Geosmithia morbida]|uniref:F-box domain-containing protein n=1 Tax=Geosmithia morbida TaxID=1094350 RepID=A0A9P4YUJ9_9HYPO|nr:uncharacterized protein GMORB2_6608 [Geosmithia morbida]KAF4123060.1 hypothetical protein GMORB2_6608 [Geosmithia morbida]